MKKYVSKEDVEKGLVDLSKPLTEQKEYLESVENKNKQIRIDNKKANEYSQKFSVENGQKSKPQRRNRGDLDDKGHKDDKDHQEKEQGDRKGQQGHKDKRAPRRERDNRVKYNWNWRDVTEETVVPELPKKEVPKPDHNKFHEQLDALKKERDQLFQKKSEVYNELRNNLRNTNESKKNNWAVNSKYSALFQYKLNQKKLLKEEMNILNEKKDGIDKELTGVKNKIKSLTKPENDVHYSKYYLQRKIEATEQRLTTAQLNKNYYNRANARIQELKRLLPDARSELEISAEVNRLRDQDNILFQQLKDVKKVINEKYKEIKAIQKYIDQINEERDAEKVPVTDQKTPEQLKADAEAKIQKLEKYIQATSEKMTKLKEAFNKSLDAYEDYTDLLRYVQMVKEQKYKIQKRKEEQYRYLKEKYERYKKRIKYQEERERKRQERIQREEERRKQAEERRAQLQKQREDFINRNPHHEKIYICDTLIRYCESLKPENIAKAQRQYEKVAQPITELKADENKYWYKELKKGAQVIVSKKLNKDAEIAPQKIQKYKKKKYTNEGVLGFTHQGYTIKLFDEVKTLPPLTVQYLDNTIAQLKEKIEIFSKPTEEEIAAFKIKAEKYFDYLHGLSDEKAPKKGQFKEKDSHNDNNEATNTEEVKYKPRKKGKNEKITNETDFPNLN